MWESIEKKIYLLRTYDYKGERFIVFFVYTPTPFKVRGEYKIFNINDKKGIKEFIEEHNDFELQFNYINDEVQIDETVIDFLIEEETEFYLDYFKANNRKKEIYDILDVLDFISELDGHIYLNPLDYREKFAKYLEDGESDFTISEEESDYLVPVLEFVTASEYSTLSYRFLLIGKEVVNNIPVDRKRFYSFPIINQEGEVDIDYLTFMIKDEKKLELVYEYLHEYIVGGVEKDGNKLYVKLNLEELKNINTIHELKINMDLLKQREQLRLLLKSKNALKTSIRKLAEMAGVPIPRRYENLYLRQHKRESVDYTLKVKTEYKHVHVEAGDNKFKDILKSANIDMKYIENLIMGYLNGKISDDYIDSHIRNAQTAFVNELVGNSFTNLFSYIKGRNSLAEMYKDIDEIAQTIEYYQNIVKIKLTPFGKFEGNDINNFIYRFYTGGLQDTRMLDNQSIYMKFDNDLVVNIKTEVKM